MEAFCDKISMIFTFEENKMNSNICNHCGCDTEYRNGGNVCPVCGAYQPKVISEEELFSLQEAFRKLRLYEFDEAERDFEEMIRRYPRNSEAYWGHMMAKYGIKYEWVSDGKKAPVPDAPLQTSLTEDDDFRKAVALADEPVAAFYRIQAEMIDSLHKPIALREAEIATSAVVSFSDEDDVRRKRFPKLFFILGASALLIIAAIIAILFLSGDCEHREAIGAAVAPTCTQEGKTEWKYCSVCKETLVPPTVIPAIGHTSDSAICTEDQHCVVCGEILKNASAHIPGKASDCENGQKCDVCGYELSPALGHTPGDPATCEKGQFCVTCNQQIASESHVPGIPATCTEDQTCVLCGFVIERGGHKAEPATCDAGSYCTVCNEELSGPLSHVPGPAPTCTTGQHCTLCDKELASDTGHLPNRDATCVLNSVCHTCGEILENARGHNLSEFISCTDGQHCRSCYDVIVPARAHTPGPAATCTEAQGCLACTEELAPALEHRITDWIVDKEPALGIAGARHGFCSACGESVSEEIAPLYSEGLSYIFNADGTYTIGGAGSCKDEWIVLPSVHEGIAVTAIADNAFYNCAWPSSLRLLLSQCR